MTKIDLSLVFLLLSIVALFLPLEVTPTHPRLAAELLRWPRRLSKVTGNLEWQDESYVDVKEFEALDLDCEFFGAPAPNVTWVRGGQDIRDYDFPGISVTDRPGHLNIDSVRKINTGTFACFVQNPYGSTYHIFHVSVTSLNDVSIPIENLKASNIRDLKIAAGESEATLKCEAAECLGRRSEDGTVAEWAFSRSKKTLNQLNRNDFRRLEIAAKESNNTDTQDITEEGINRFTIRNPGQGDSGLYVCGCHSQGQNAISGRSGGVSGYRVRVLDNSSKAIFEDPYSEYSPVMGCTEYGDLSNTVLLWVVEFVAIVGAFVVGYWMGGGWNQRGCGCGNRTRQDSESESGSGTTYTYKVQDRIVGWRR